MLTCAWCATAIIKYAVGSDCVVNRGAVCAVCGGASNRDEHVGCARGYRGWVIEF